MKIYGVWCASVLLLALCVACAPHEEHEQSSDPVSPYSTQIDAIDPGGFARRGRSAGEADGRLLGLATSSLVAPERYNLGSQLAWPPPQGRRGPAGLEVMLLDSSTEGEHGLLLDCGRVEAWRECPESLDVHGGPCVKGWRDLGEATSWLDLAEGGSLGIAELPEGEYNALRVRVLGAALEKDGGVEEIGVEENFQQGVVIPLKFSLHGGALITLAMGLHGHDALTFIEGKGWVVSADGLEVVGIAAERWGGLPPQGPPESRR